VRQHRGLHSSKEQFDLVGGKIDSTFRGRESLPEAYRINFLSRDKQNDFIRGSSKVRRHRACVSTVQRV